MVQGKVRSGDQAGGAHVCATARDGGTRGRDGLNEGSDLWRINVQAAATTVFVGAGDLAL